MYKVEFGYPMDIWTGGSVWIGYCWTFEDAVEDFDRRIKHETIDSRKIDTVVMQKSGFIYIGKSRYQAEQALSYLKRNYPNYNNHHISGTGAWDDPYCVHMSKEIRTYDMRTKKEFICESDYN